MKIKSVFLLSSLTMALGLGVFAGVSRIHENSSFSKAEAAYDLPTSDGSLYYKSYWNDSWSSEDARIFGHFLCNEGGKEYTCWTSTYVNQSDYEIYYDSTEHSTIYYCYPSDTTHTWTSLILVRCGSEATSGNFDYGTGKTGCWDQTKTITLSNSYNMYAPHMGGDSTEWKSRNSNYLVYDIGTVYSSGTSLYLDLNWAESEWEADSLPIKAHFWSSNKMLNAVDVEMHYIKGFYNNEGQASESSNTALYEVVVPGTTSKEFWRAVKFFRGSWVNETEAIWSNSRHSDDDGTILTTNNVFKIIWHNNPGAYYGRNSWNMSDEDRANKFGRYIQDQTGTICANYATNTESSFSSAWTNIQGDGAWNTMCDGAKDSFKEANIGDTDNREKGAKRYNYILAKYGYKEADAQRALTNFAGRDIVPLNQLDENGDVISESAFIAFAAESKNNAMLIIALITAIATVVSLGYALLRKRKEI